MKPFFLAVFLGVGLTAHAEKVVLRVGHFPNVTHAQAVIAHGLSRAGRGWFEERLGPEVEVRWMVFNAGPSTMEAIFAKSIEMTYVGPNPALNAHLKSQGAEIRIVAGACSGGAALVVQPDGRFRTDADFRGKKIATPQLGNTQDVACRAWLRSKGLKVTMTGGEAFVIPTANPDQLALFRRGALDAVWTVEPWVTRLVLEAGGRIYLEESEIWPGGRYVTTHLVSRVRFLEEHPTLLKKWLAAHVELTDKINRDPAWAKQIFNEELKAETTQALPKALLDRVWARLQLTHDPIRDSLLKSAEDAYRIGFLRRPPDLSRIYDLRLLNAALRDMNRPEVP
ncbi:MAG: ABC transporter substrate-binding protein [Verrucomicrobiae bacterium]|nr:ABC transporter substrate-binding protein [Verrucomicrobiae bacterium]